MSQLPSEARVTTNFAPKHYGVSAGSLFNAAVDPADQKYYDSVEDTWRIHKMTWYIEKGDDLLRSRKIEFPFYIAWDHEPTDADLHIESELQESSLDRAPVYPKSGKHIPELSISPLPVSSSFSEF